MKRFIEKNPDYLFDLVVVGGGITGAAVAYEAASRGLKVALIEKKDFGGATSAATSKLIHGGLRYLKNMEFGLVRESLRERRVWENIAPNFVHPLPFLIPTYQNLKSNKWILGLGMMLYDVLSFDKDQTWDITKKLPNHKTLTANEALLSEPNLKNSGLTGASVYYDCQNIFPERLTLAFVKSAYEHGAQLANYTKVTGFIKQNEKICGVRVRDELSKETYQIRSRLTVNCAGTWADIILNMASDRPSDHKIKRSEGIHFLTRKINGNNAVALMSENGRHFMILPWRGYSLIGTTDKEYNGNPDNYRVSKESIMDLINDVNNNYGGDTLTYDDVIFAYGGLRPLVDEQTEGSYESSRKYEICDNAENNLDGLLTVEGGKYTTSRNLADQLMKIVQEKLQQRIPASVTYRKHLAGSEIDDMQIFMAGLHENYPDFNRNTIQYLGRNYGTESHAVFDIARRNRDLKAIVTHDGELLAEVEYAIQQEMAQTLSDILFRRTGVGTIGHPGKNKLQKIAELAADKLNWSNARLAEEMQSVENELKIP